jgi:signal transduction histidine kinase
MKRWWADTLFKRLLLLMWAALVVSHLCAFLIVRSVLPVPGSPGGPGIGDPLPLVLGSLPPGGLGTGPPHGLAQVAPGTRSPPSAEPGGMDPAAGLPAEVLWLDYAARWVIIGMAAWFGARWLALPMRRLAAASNALAQSLGHREATQPLNEQRGTLEVRQTAQVFNAMALRLQEQFEAQGLLLAAISHDLRTPLARLRLRLEEMSDQRGTDRCIADVQEMDRMIASVLGMMRDTRNQVPRQRIDVRALAQAIVDDLAEQGQPVRLADADGLPSVVVLAQPAAIDRVLANLIGNALRHGGSADVSLAVADGKARIRVDDDGPGIPAHRLDAVFEPFFRVDASRSRPTAGSGLGLHIARDLAQRNGAQLTLANRPEGGLRAELVLALA